MFIAKNNDLIIMAKPTKKELEQALNMMVYTSIEETETDYSLYDGEYKSPEEIAVKEHEKISKLSLTKREVFLALYKSSGLTPGIVRGKIEDPEALIEFDYATEYLRQNPLIDKIGKVLGYTSEEIDKLFKEKILPDKKTTE